MQCKTITTQQFDYIHINDTITYNLSDHILLAGAKENV